MVGKELQHQRRLASSAVVFLLSASMLVPLARFGIDLDDSIVGLGHFALFFIVGLLVMTGRSGGRVVALILLLLWSVALEAGQLLMTSRHADISDLGANLLGILLAYAIAPRHAWYDPKKSGKPWRALRDRPQGRGHDCHQGLFGPCAIPSLGYPSGAKRPGPLTSLRETSIRALRPDRAAGRSEVKD